MSTIKNVSNCDFPVYGENQFLLNKVQQEFRQDTGLKLHTQGNGFTATFWILVTIAALVLVTFYKFYIQPKKEQYFNFNSVKSFDREQHRKYMR